MAFNIAKRITHRHGTHRIAKKTSAAGKQVLDMLNSFIEDGKAEPIFWLTRIWNDQQRAITYKELREAILSGQMDEARCRHGRTTTPRLSTKTSSLCG